MIADLVPVQIEAAAAGTDLLQGLRALLIILIGPSLHRNERGVALLRLELGQICRSHLAALAGDLEQPA